MASQLGTPEPELRTRVELGEGASLEAAITPPPASSVKLAVVCHPWGKLGGCMDDGVVRTVSRALALGGIGVCRFNFRGVGESTGSSGYTGNEQVHERDIGRAFWSRARIALRDVRQLFFIYLF